MNANRGQQAQLAGRLHDRRVATDGLGGRAATLDKRPV